MNDEYVFFFVGGSGGSFAKVVFHYYLYKLNRTNQKTLFKVDSVTGHCHNNNVANAHCHYIDQLDLSKKIVLVDFDNDDVPYIIKMAYHKVVKQQIANDPAFLKTQWGHRFFDVDHNDDETVKKILLKNPNYLIFDNWREQVSKLNPVLVIKFKDIMFGDINTVVANFFQVPVLSELNDFIEQYRQANQKYLTSI